MDAASPNQSANELERQASNLLINSRRAVLTMTTGGCARYAFSSDIDFCLDRKGAPLLVYASNNPHHHLVITNTSMDLRIAHQIDHEGNELSILILTGMLRMVDPGDHESIDRYHRYFGIVIENFSRGSNRLYRFEAQRAGFELFSGERKNVGIDSLIRKSIFSRKEEEKLIDYCRSSFPVDRHGEAVGVDSGGIDFKCVSGINRLSFPAPVNTAGQAMAYIAESSSTK